MITYVQFSDFTVAALWLIFAALTYTHFNILVVRV